MIGKKQAKETTERKNNLELHYPSEIQNRRIGENAK